MRVKEIDRTANIAWSPAAQHPIYIAAGTAAQQLDATFSTSAALELYHLDLGEPGMDMDMVGSITTDCRFHKLVWGSYGMDTEEQSSGLLMGGADNGNLFIWNPAKIISKEEPLVHKLDKHSGAVAALDINPFQKNLLASGASDSEIYIWDLNNPSNPMTPGAKSQPPDDVTCISWNRQVQHILASTYAGRCVVWDLRKNEPIIKVSDSMARIKCKLVQWQPEVATQLCLASEDDHTPVIQLWDLRFATSPLKLLENHTRGILSMAWCPQDPDLLLSCGKDNRILCWNPNTQAQQGEVVYELPTSNQWSFDVQWCPRNPAMISSCSFDGHVSVHSLMGGTPPPKTPSKVADSFSTDPFAQPPAAQQQSQASGEPAPVVLKKAPKWLRRPVGASFAFGGKLVTFAHEKPGQQQQQQQVPRKLVHISQVVTETALVARSDQLQAALASGQLSQFCDMKIANSQDKVDENVWNFLKVHFEPNVRQRYLQLLGYNQSELAQKVTNLTSEAPPAKQPTSGSTGGVDASELADKMASLDTNVPSDEDDSEEQEEEGRWNFSSNRSSPFIPTGEEESAFDTIATAAKETEEHDKPLPFATGNSSEALITAALLTADFPSAVEVCLHEERYAEAIVLAIAGGQDLLRSTQQRFFQRQQGELSRLVASVVGRQHHHIMRTCTLDNWREALALALTYAKPDEFSALCDILGERLERENGGELAMNACLCYICAGNVDKLVQCWIRLNHNHDTPAALQDLVEKVMLLRKAVEMQGSSGEVADGALAEKLSKYAELLAAEGSLATAANYLGNSQQMSLAVMRDRLYEALGQPLAQKPFSVYNVQPEGRQPQQPQQPQQPTQLQANRQRTNSGFHQSLAGQSSTTPTSSYHYPTSSYSQPSTVNQYPTPSPAPAPAPSLYNPAAHAPQPQPPQQPQPGVLAKGPLAHKYAAPVSTAPAYDGYNAAPTSQYNSAFTPSSTYESQPQPSMYDPTAHNTPVFKQENYREKFNSSSSSLEKLKMIFNKPDTATEIIRNMAPRRGSRLDDAEAIAARMKPRLLRRTTLSEMYTEKEAQLAYASRTRRRSSGSVFHTMTENGQWPRGSTGSNPTTPTEPMPNPPLPIIYNPYTGAPPYGAPPSGPPQPAVSSFQDARPATAWNDPPPITRKKTISESSHDTPAPITAPVGGAPAPDQGPPGAPSYSQYYNPAQYTPAAQPPASQPPPPAPEPPKPVVKAPIPAENQVLKDILEKLTTQCMANATNPQTKRKLDDVTRKLETLYDKLRAQALSPNVIQGLHQLVQCIQQYDYATGLQYHSHMVSQGNFSEISSFMPGLKILMQTAQQMQVYVQ